MKNAKNKLKRLLSFILAGIFISGVAYAAISNKIFMKGALFATATVLVVKLPVNIDLWIIAVHRLSAFLAFI